MDLKKDSEIQQPLLKQEKNTQSSLDETKKNLLPAEYQWILDDYKEVDYSKVEARIKSIPFNLKRAGANIEVKEISLILHKNIMIAEYHIEQEDLYAEEKCTIDIHDLSTYQIIKTIELEDVFEQSRLCHQNFNDVDYCFYQQGQFVYLMKLDDFIEE
ncbi:UNKNOWN [Stylonychia lemnae]|uniref:Uncharacterized protein n=1 Tax=Stylonychia lemnae TaxID=5949 RepID=A0A077ZPK4_STYLE|nr:UNKNOWN [Stylonychia lemnae]|eukprot:CDW71818.1 UNKNOWN [Stylonychia lemnae]